MVNGPSAIAITYVFSPMPHVPLNGGGILQEVAKVVSDDICGEGSPDVGQEVRVTGYHSCRYRTPQEAAKYIASLTVKRRTCGSTKTRKAFHNCRVLPSGAPKQPLSEALEYTIACEQVLVIASLWWPNLL